MVTIVVAAVTIVGAAVLVVGAAMTIIGGCDYRWAVGDHCRGCDHIWGL